jgi:acyl carrier protein
MDYQVKVRGFRIELGEIESQLRRIEHIDSAVVIDREDHGGYKYLCAYIIPGPGSGVDPVGIKETLARVLPSYMVPAHVISLDAFPLTVNGKIDRRALPVPVIGSIDNYVPPQDENQEKMVEIWAELLGMEKEKIGINDNFFDLGGHSLRATILAARIHKTFATDISLGDIFKSPTIKSICTLISITQWAREQDRKTGTEGEEIEVLL